MVDDDFSELPINIYWNSGAKRSSIRILGSVRVCVQLRMRFEVTVYSSAIISDMMTAAYGIKGKD